MAQVDCYLDESEVACLGRLRTEACRMGGDIVYNVPKKALRPVERGMVYRAQVAHTREAKKHGRRRPLRQRPEPGHVERLLSMPPAAGRRGRPRRAAARRPSIGRSVLLTVIRNVSIRLAVVLALSACAHGQQPTPEQLARATEKLETWRKGRTTRVHGRLRRAETVSRRERQAETARRRREARRLLRRFDHGPVAARGRLPGQAVRQPRHQRPDHVADAGPLPRRRDRARAQGGRDPGRHQRHRRQHRADLARGDRGQLRDHGRAGARARHPRRAVVGAAGAQLHAGVRADVPACVRPRRSPR